ncbi:MAG: Ig-like domain-containing protein, partial [Bacteroidota bacterium]
GKAYRLTFFGSRENTEERVTRYRVNNNITERSYELTTSGTDLGAEGYDGNNNTVVTTDLFFNTDAFRITVERATGSFAYLSGMKLEEFAGNAVVNVTDLSLSGADITDNGGTTQLVATTIPADATFQEVTWTIDDPTVAALGADGHLTAITNGTVVATARPTEPGTSVRAQIKIEISNQESRSVFLDCGPDDGINGNATLSPDANGTHWNNAVSSIGGADSVFLVDATGAATGYALTIGKAMSTNGLRHGGLTDPVDSLLGDFAIGTATQDYFFTSNSGILTFSGLDPEKGYRFHLFASRATDDPRTTGYAVNGLNGASGDLASSNNDRRTFSTDLVRPLPDGTLNLEITNEVGQFGY